MEQTRSPIKDKPLRNPGQSVREQRVDLAYDKLLAPGIVVLMLALWTAHEWFRFFYPAPPQPLVASVFLVGFIGYAWWQYRRTWPKIRALKQAEDGEKAVGQLLEGLRGQGYAVFHDLVGDDFNVDHVIIGPAGAFTIETKTWSKPAKGSPKNQLRRCDPARGWLGAGPQSGGTGQGPGELAATVVGRDRGQGCAGATGDRFSRVVRGRQPCQSQGLMGAGTEGAFGLPCQ